MSFQKLPKGSILLIEALDPLAIDTANNQFEFGGTTLTAPGNKYSSLVAATNLLSYANKTQKRFRRVSEHNRSEFNEKTLRIEQNQRMANGLLRKYYVADKKQWDISWTMLPSYRNETTDGGWGAEDIKQFYESSDGKGSFRIKINPTVFSTELIEQSDGVLADDYTYTVVFTSCDFTVVKRGLQTYWNVKLSMEQV